MRQGNTPRQQHHMLLQKTVDVSQRHQTAIPVTGADTQLSRRTLCRTSNPDISSPSTHTHTDVQVLVWERQPTPTSQTARYHGNRFWGCAC